MKILTINYPKKESDNERINKFSLMYNDIKPQIDEDAKKFNDLPKFKITGVQRAGFLVQFK